MDDLLRAQSTPRSRWKPRLAFAPNRVSAPELRCLFAVLGSYFHRFVFAA
jgi:hypothetical protein